MLVNRSKFWFLMVESLYKLQVQKYSKRMRKVCITDLQYITVYAGEKCVKLRGDEV